MIDLERADEVPCLYRPAVTVPLQRHWADSYREIWTNYWAARERYTHSDRSQSLFDLSQSLWDRAREVFRSLKMPELR